MAIILAAQAFAVAPFGFEKGMTARQITSIIGSDAIKLTLQLGALLLIQMFAKGAREALEGGRVLDHEMTDARLQRRRVGR